MKQLLASALGYALLASGAGLAEEIPHQRSIALIDKTWAVSLDMTGYRVQADGVKPDSRRYVLATNDAAAMQLSVTLEAVSGQATEQGCLAHLHRIAQTAAAPSHAGPTRTEINQLPVFEYLLHETSAGRTEA